MLPPFGRFLARRFRERHNLRVTYEVDMDVRREAFMRPRGIDPQNEAARAHSEHLLERAIALRERVPAEDEICERLDMVRRMGVLPIPPTS